MNKLIHAEASRMVNVIEESLDKLSCLSVIPTASSGGGQDGVVLRELERRGDGQVSSLLKKMSKVSHTHEQQLLGRIRATANELEVSTFCLHKKNNIFLTFTLYPTK